MAKTAANQFDNPVQCDIIAAYAGVTGAKSLGAIRSQMRQTGQMSILTP
jgi:hypothetical protein